MGLLNKETHQCGSKFTKHFKNPNHNASFFHFPKCGMTKFNYAILKYIQKGINAIVKFKYKLSNLLIKAYYNNLKGA